MKHHHTKTWTERVQPAEAAAGMPDLSDIPNVSVQSFKHAHTSMGSTGHAGRGIAGRLIHMAGVFTPLIAGELVQDATKYKKTVRLASIGTAIAYEVLDLVNEAARRKEQAEKLAECRGRE